VNNPYLELTEELNRGRLRALLSSGQAVVVHRLAIMSKDGDWILRQDGETVVHVLGVLALDEALDRERRALMRANEERLGRYQAAAESWAAQWPAVQRRIEGLPLLEAHRVVTSSAEGNLPFEPNLRGAS
jgi:hypothetical protein